MAKTIWGNCIVKNESRYLWFAVKSVIEHLDKILIWDTGSSDDTLEIITLLKKEYGKKIKFKEIGEVDEVQFSEARQKMLDQTKSDWIFVLDGDEVWWRDSIKKIVDVINKKGDQIDLIVNPYFSIVGDIYHYQEELAGQYSLAGRKGHLNIRAINREIPGLHVGEVYGKEGFYDLDNKRIQEGDQSRITYLEAPYLHFSNIERSSVRKGDSQVMQRSRKIRHEIGIKFPDDFKYPEVLYLDRPDLVLNPWGKMDTYYKIRAMIETPLRKLKRRIK